MNPALNLDPTSLSPLALFLNADWVVKIVMIGLLLASIWTWTIIVALSLRIGRTRRQMKSFEAAFWQADDVDAFHQHCLEEGAMLAVSGEPVDQAWGWREFALKDPDGYVWSVYQDKSAGQWT